MIVDMIVINNHMTAWSALTDPSQAGESSIDDQDPTASQAERPALSSELDEDPEAQSNERYPDDSPHPCVDGMGDGRAGQYRRGTQCEHDSTMSDRVKERQAEAPSASLRSAAEVGDGSDVIPVDPMAQPERQRSQK